MKAAAQRRNKYGTLARRDADGRCGGKQSDDQAVAPTALRRQSERRRVRRPHVKERGKSASGSARNHRTLKSAAGKSASLDSPALFPNAPDRHPEGQDYRLGPLQWIERVAQRAAQKEFAATIGDISLSKWQVQITNRLLGQARSGI
jgi:sRNA-binding protein